MIIDSQAAAGAKIYKSTAIINYLAMDSILPVMDGVKHWLLETIRHSNHMEYYCGILGFGSHDPDRPGHDVAGANNKLEWDIIKGCSLAYFQRGGPDDSLVMDRIMVSVRLHRMQWHHKVIEDGSADEEEMLLASLDVICALLEKRPYYKSIDTLEELDQEVDSIFNQCEKRKLRIGYILKVSDELKKVKRPDISQIDTLLGFPNIGISENTYGLLHTRMAESLRMLKDEHGYILNI